MHDSHELFAASIEVIGAKKVASALNLSLAHTYRLQRSPLDEDPNGTGARNDVDRIEQLVDVLAAHPRARPVLHRWRLYFDALFRRAIDHEDARPVSEGAFAERVGQAVIEFGEMLKQCGSDVDPARVAKEGAETIEAIERLVRSALAGVTPDNAEPPLRRVQ